MKPFKDIALKKTNATGTKDEESLSQEKVNLGDKTSTFGTSADSPN